MAGEEWLLLKEKKSSGVGEEVVVDGKRLWCGEGKEGVGQLVKKYSYM